MTDEVIEVQQEEIQATPEANQEPVQESVPEPEAPKPAKTFTQEELNRQIEKRLARERSKFEREAAELRQIAMQREQRPQQQAEPGEPKLEDFDNFDSYIAAKAEYVADRKIQATLSERDKRDAAVKAQTAQAKTVEGWNKRVAAAAVEMPDFHDVVANADVPLSRPMAEAIMDSEAGPKLAYYLATHQDEAADIAEMGPVAAIRALTRIEDKLAAETAKASKAPPPVSPVGAKAKAEKSPSEMTDKEFAEWRRRQIKAR